MSTKGVRKQNIKRALIPKLRFPEFRNLQDWESRPIGKVYSFKSNNSLSREKLNYQSGSVKNIHYGDIHTKFSTHFDITKEVVPYINASESAEALKPENFCLEGDMIFADASEDLEDIGKAIEIVRLNDERVLSGLHTIWARPNKDELVSGFGGHLFKSNWVRIQIQKEAQGTKVLGLSVRRFSNIKIAIPSRPEQQKITDCLTSLDELIFAYQQKLDALRNYKKGLLQQLFPCEGETIPRLRFPEFQSAPKWELHPLDTFVIKSFYGTSSSTSPKGQYPVLRMGNMVDGGLNLSNLVYIDLEPSAFESFRLMKGDILLNRTNSPALVGKVSLFQLESEYMTASYIVTYRLDKERLNPAFCNYMLNTALYQTRIKALAKPSVSQVNINPTSFRKELIIAVPSVVEQNCIAACLSSLDEKLKSESEKLKYLMIHKKGLMQQLFPCPSERENEQIRQDSQFPFV